MTRSLPKSVLTSLCLGLLVLSLVRPAAAIFPTSLQSICDPDFPGCSSGVSGLTGARAIAVTPDGKHVYFCSSLDDALTAFTHLQTILDTDPGINGLDSCRGIAVSPDGQHVYTAGLLDDALAVWSRDSIAGSLTFVEVKIDGSGGADGLDGATSVTVSPDGKHVYVAGRTDDAIAVFSRNATTGQVTFLQALFDGVALVDGLDAAEEVRVSPDGKHVYVAAENDNAIAVFARETSSISGDFVG